MKLIWRALINAAAIAVAAFFVPGITYGTTAYGFGEADKYISLLATGLVLGIVNAFIRPIIELVSAPITCLTLGLFHFVIGALMLYVVSLVPVLGFNIDGPVTAFLGAIVISVVGVVLSWILPD
jgi:putative membrane protein